MRVKEGLIRGKTTDTRLVQLDIRQGSCRTFSRVISWTCVDRGRRVFRECGSPGFRLSEELLVVGLFREMCVRVGRGGE